MDPCVEYCQKNVTADVRERLAECPVESTGRHCLEHCGHCYRRPFLVVDGEFVVGESHERLITDATRGTDP